VQIIPVFELDIHLESKSSRVTATPADEPTVSIVDDESPEPSPRFDLGDSEVIARWVAELFELVFGCNSDV
jgi:hypothetical protein